MDMSLNNKIYQFYRENIANDNKEDEIEIYGYHDENKKHEVDVIHIDNMYENGLKGYGTIGAYDYDIGMTVDGKSLRVEFVGIARSNVKLFPNILSTCAFKIVNAHFACKPGLVYPDVVKMYYPNVNMKHLYLVTPFLWDGEYTIDIGPYIVTWLQVIPISDAELEYIKRNGSEAFEDLLDKKEVDFLNLNRPSIV